MAASYVRSVRQRLAVSIGTGGTTHDTSSEEEIEAALRQLALEQERFGLTERRFELVRQAVLLAMTVVLTFVTVVCAIYGVRWSIPIATGSGGLATGIASILEGRRADRNRGGESPKS